MARTARDLRRRGTLLLAGALLASACGSAGSDGSGSTGDGNDEIADDFHRATIIATTAIWADVVSEIVCVPDIAVDTLIPNDADPHLYEPTFRDQERLEGASLIVANGLSLEGAWTDALTTAAERGEAVFTIGDHLDRRDGDPHVWFDPDAVASIIPDLVVTIVETTGAPKDVLDECAASYIDRLIEADAEIATVLESVPPEHRVLVTNHDALGYLADRYGYEVLDSILPSSTLSEASPADLERLEESIVSLGVSAIFAEFQHNGAEAEAIASRLGDSVEVVYLYTGTLGEPGSGADTYLGLLAYDAVAIATALGGDADGFSD